jgi:hypothetical protein
MRIKFTLTAIVLTVGISVELFAQDPSKETVDSACLMKSSSEWASECEQCLMDGNTYRINMQNICERKIDVRLAVQEKTMRWKVFNFMDISPGDTLSGYACDGTGRYVYWTRVANDASVVFPTEREIQLQFNR